MKIKNEKGITLVALIVTIVVLIILTGVGIISGTKSLNNVKLKSFYTKLEIATEGVEKIYNTNENYKGDGNNTVYLKNLGTTPTEEQNNLIKQVLKVQDLSDYNFRYFTAKQVEEDLEISGVDLNLLIDFENVIVINPEGIEIDGTRYYTLESTKYKVSLNSAKNRGTPNFTYQVERYGSNSYKITVTPINIGDINEGIVKYKKATADYWKVAEDKDIIIKDLTNYNIMYIDANNNSVTKTISISLDNQGNVTSDEINE